MPRAEYELANAPGLQPFDAPLPQGTRGLYAEFHMEGVMDPVASEKEGRPIYKDTEFITIRIAGDKDNDVSRPVRPQDKIAWPNQYAAFKAGQDQPVEGTPLDELRFLTKAQVLELKAVGVKTAEHLRDMPDAVAQRFMGITTLRKKASDYLDAAAGNAPLLAIRAEAERKGQEIAVLKQALEEQGKKIEELIKAKKG